MSRLCICIVYCVVFFFKQKTAYEMRISDWSSDVCSSDLAVNTAPASDGSPARTAPPSPSRAGRKLRSESPRCCVRSGEGLLRVPCRRSEEHTSEIQSLMRISYAAFCLNKKM